MSQEAGPTHSATQVNPAAPTHSGAPTTPPAPYEGPERRLPGQPPYAGAERRTVPDPAGLDRGRSSGLDGLRAFAALLVVAFHLETVSGVSFGPLDPIIRGGNTGVYLFFALSGYLLYKPFVRGRVDVVHYGLKRSARILPGYFVALVGLAVITGSRLPMEHPLPYLAIASSYDIPLRGFLGNAWTLSAEVLFYLSLPLLGLLPKGREFISIMSLAVVSAGLAVVHRALLDDGNAWLTGAYPLVFYAFVPGMVLAIVEVRHPAQLRRLARWPSLAIGSILLVVGALTAVVPVALASGVGTVLVMGWLLHRRLGGAHALRFVGGASYALYLWHKDAFIAFGPWVGLGIALGAAALSWAIVERPILARAHAAVAHRRAAMTPTPLPATAP